MPTARLSFNSDPPPEYAALVEAGVEQRHEFAVILVHETRLRVHGLNFHSIRR